MEQDIQNIRQTFKEELAQGISLLQLETRYLGRKGLVNELTKKVKIFEAKERGVAGKALNELKAFITQELEQRKTSQAHSETFIDVSLPGTRMSKGHTHLLTQVQKEMMDMFESLNFAVVEGPEVETEFYNFDALNIPAWHPARDLWQTFWLTPGLKHANPGNHPSETLLLRTHTSPMQGRFMEAHQPPFRIVVPGRVFRYEASDATHGFQFYQLEGLMVDKDISIANFKSVLETFFKKLFGKEYGGMRLRPSYFPFTEPSFEVDFYWKKQERWLEIMGAGMVHPQVFETAGFAPEELQGFAFGLGIDRVAMLKYAVPDIRLLYEGDLRFNRQF